MNTRIKAITWLLTGILACALLFAPAPKSEAFTFWLWGGGYENFLTYTEVDPNNRFTVTLHKVDVAALPRNEDAYLYSDKGVNSINGNFSYDYEFYMSSSTVSGGTALVWGVANNINDYNGIIAASQPILFTYLVNTAGTAKIYLVESYTGSVYTDTDDIAFNTLYYARVIRDESTNTLYHYTFSDKNRSVLVASESLALHAYVDFRYYYPIDSNNTGSAAAWTGYSQNHLIQ